MKESRRRFEQAEFRHRQAKTRSAMENAGVDLLIVYDPANMCWLTGYDGWSFYVHQCVVIGTDGTLFWYGRGIDAKGAELTTDLTLKDILPYPDEYVMSPERHPMEFLANILKEKGSFSKKSYIFSFLRVTLQPIGIFSLSLKFAIDFFA